MPRPPRAPSASGWAVLLLESPDELVLNIAPVLESEGLRLRLATEHYAELKLLELRDLGGGVVQLRYALDGRAA